MDVVMPSTGNCPNAFKIISAVARKTWGWNKDADNISMDQLHTMTGISSRRTLVKAIKDAEQTGYLRRWKHGKSFAYQCIASTETVLDYVKDNSTETVLQDSPQYRFGTGDSTETVHTISNNKRSHTPPEEKLNRHGGTAVEHVPSPAGLEWQAKIDEMVSVLALVCHMDVMLSKSDLENYAILLLEGDYTTEQIRRGFYGKKSYWYLDSFGAKNGRPPKMGNIRNEIKIAAAWKPNANPNGRTPHSNGTSHKQVQLDTLIGLVNRFGRTH